MKYIDRPDQLAALLFLASQVKHSLWVMAYNVSRPRPGAHPTYRQLWDTLTAAPSRGIDCRMILPNLTDSHGLPTHENASLVDLAAAGWRLRRVRSAGLQHSKNWLLDTGAAIITSANLSQSALTLNIEDMIVLQGQHEAAPARANFSTHWRAAVDWNP